MPIPDDAFRLLQRQVNTLQSVLGGLVSSGTNISSGNGAPTAAATAGSIYIRRDGAAGSRMYVAQGGTVWVAIAAV